MDRFRNKNFPGWSLVKNYSRIEFLLWLHIRTIHLCHVESQAFKKYWAFYLFLCVNTTINDCLSSRIFKRLNRFWTAQRAWWKCRRLYICENRAKSRLADLHKLTKYIIAPYFTLSTVFGCRLRVIYCWSSYSKRRQSSWLGRNCPDPNSKHNGR